MMSTTALAGTNSIVNPNPMKFPTHPWIIASDDPRNGGISGTLGKFDKPNPWACEERPKMIDPETGEWVYVDVYKKEHQQDNPVICYMA